MSRNLIKFTLLLCFALQVSFVFPQTNAKKTDQDDARPKFTITLNYMELSILNSAMVDGISKYKGNIELATNARYIDNQVFWEITTMDKLVFEVLNLYVAQKSMEFLKTINIDNANPVEKFTLVSLSALSAKLDAALNNPVWDIRKISGILTNEGGRYFISANNRKAELTGLLINGLKGLDGKNVVATGFIKEPGKMETTGIRQKKDKTLELFIMSQCPYGIQALKYIFDKTDSMPVKTQFNFEVHYLFSKSDSIYSSLHGEPEIIENLVQMVIRDQYPQFFTRYLRQRIVSSSESWQQIAANSKMDKNIIRQIETEIIKNRDSIISTEYQYMTGNFQQINSSPTYIWESEIVNTLEEIPGFQGGRSDEIQKCKN